MDPTATVAVAAATAAIQALSEVLQQYLGSGSGWIYIEFGHGSQIRIWNQDPDSGSRCLKIGIKSLNLLRETVFVTFDGKNRKMLLLR
jgi:hypothetical protein